MRPIMIFKFGITIIVFVAIVIFYILHNQQESNVNNIEAVRQKALKDDHTSSSINKLDIEVNNRNFPKNKSKDKTLNSKEDTKIKVEEQKGQEKPLLKGDKEKKNIQASKKENKKDTNQNKDQANQENLKSSGHTSHYLKPVFMSTENRSIHGIHLSLVACGDRRDESLVLLKSAVLLAKKKLIFHIFAEKDLQKGFRDQLEFWPDEMKDKIEYFIYDITFPAGEKTDEWKKLFKPCASQRLFIPSLLTDIDSLLYVDTDILFLSSIDDVWDHFNKFNYTQLASLAPEHEDAAAAWYNRFARHPFYGKLGLNSGVMLMNLTRLRASTWLPSLLAYYKEYALKITWGDQDLINIYFYYHPDQLYVWSCEWNYRPDHCMYMSVCKNAENVGALILHGCRRVFHNDKQPAFRAVYNAFRDHRFGADIKYNLLSTVRKNLEHEQTTPCGKHPQIFTKQLETYVKIQKTFIKDSVHKNIQLDPESKNIPPPHSPR